MLALLSQSRKRKRKLNTPVLGLCLVLGLLIFTLNLNPVPASLAAGQDGTLDLTFKSGSGPNGTVRGLAQQPDGKLLVAGDFSNYDNSRKGGIVRLNPDGTLDTSFNSTGSGTNYSVYSVVLQSDGKILVGGTFQTYNEVSRFYLARLNTDGSLDTTFVPSKPDGYVYSLALQSDGKILAVGSFLTVDGISRKGIVRLNPDGSLDTTFNPGTGANSGNLARPVIYTIHLQSSGKIVIGGFFAKFNNITANRIARLNADGSVDTSFNSGTGANQLVQAIVPQDSGKMLIGGQFSTYNDTQVNYFARLNEDGSLDSSFNSGSGLNGGFGAVAVQNDGKILLGGLFSSYNATPVKGLVRLNADGTLDSSFDPGSGPNANVAALLPLTNNKLLVGGYFTSYDNQGRNFLAQLNSDGSLVATFGQINGANNTVNEIVVQPDGKILIGGDFGYYGGLSRKGIARLNADGTPDTSFNPGAGITHIDHQFPTGVHEIKVQPDGKILIGGVFSGYNGTSSNYLARLNPDGTLDTSFKVGSGANQAVFAIALQADGKILIGGYLSSYDGAAVNGVARLNSDGTLDTSFQPAIGESNQIRVILPQSDGKILVGGDYNTNTFPAFANFARFNSDGSLDSTFSGGSGGANSLVFTAIFQPDGKILLGGHFTTYHDKSLNRIARLNADGTLDATFNPGLGASYVVNSLAVQSSNKILIAGSFAKYNGTDVNYIARLNSDGSLDTSFNQADKPDSYVYSMALQPDDKILIAGRFTYVATSTRDRIARLENTPCNPLVVTNSGDDGLATNCGTFSHALLNASSGATITFALTGGSNTVTLNGALTPTLKSGVTLDGGASGVILDGTSGAGLRLGGSNTLTNLTLRGFSGPALVATSPNTQNWLYRVKLQK